MSEETEEKPGIIKRMVAGVKGFFSHAIGYIPRGIIFSAIMLAGSAALESMTGWGLLGVTEMASAGNWMGIATLGMKHLALGSLISGGIGGVVSAVNAGRAPADHLSSHTPITPSKGEVKAAEQLLGKTREAACDALVPGSSTLFGLCDDVQPPSVTSGLPVHTNKPGMMR